MDEEQRQASCLRSAVFRFLSRMRNEALLRITAHMYSVTVAQQSCDVPLQAGREAEPHTHRHWGQKVRRSKKVRRSGVGVRTLNITGLRLLAFKVGEGELVNVAAHPHRRTAGRVEHGPRAAHGAVTAARESGKINRGKEGGKNQKQKRMRTEE